MLIWWMLACGPDVRLLYDEERKHALTIAATAPDDWEADLVVSAGSGALETLLTVQLQAAFDALEQDAASRKGLGFESVKPSFRVKEVELSASDACSTCLALRVQLEGDLGVKLLGVPMSTGISGQIKGQVELGVEGGKRVVVKIRKIGKVELRSKEFDRLGFGSTESLLEEPVRQMLLRAVPAIPIVDLAATTLPIRLLRVKTHPGGVRVEVLTDVPGAGAAVLSDATGRQLRLGLSETALTGLVRRAAFERGLIPEYDIGIDPRRIDVEGQQFTLSLRLWRLVGAGWWRDYTATGTLAVVDGKLSLTVPPGSVQETAASLGAGFVDPLAALFQSAVLTAIADTLDRSLPAAAGSKQSGLRARAVATAVRGEFDTLVLDAELRTDQDGR